ncbi:hypothetical protein TU82_00645 [Pseudomonas orientalis]|nr:hypothetical protein TU82_00645 [Pseudomonas orientalis]
MKMWEGQALMPACRSELAREKFTRTAFIQKARVIVDVFREQARSYRVIGRASSLKAMAST